jgi:cardiolipin synthase
MWRKAGGEALDHRKYLRSLPEKGPAQAAVLDTSVFRNRSAIRKAYLHALRRATRSIYITNAYFLPDSGILHAIRDAKKRGVEVAVMLPAASDVMMVRYASRALYPRLLRWGVEIYEFQSHMLHAKTAVVDGIWSTVGSCNLDHRSFRLNQEANLVFLDEEIGTNLLNLFQEDKRHCVKIDIDSFEKRSIVERAIEYICYFFRTWL